jgi:hypothetical protein
MSEPIDHILTVKPHAPTARQVFASCSCAGWACIEVTEASAERSWVEHLAGDVAAGGSGRTSGAALIRPMDALDTDPATELQINDPDQVCESCGAPADVKLADGSLWCYPCDGSAERLGYNVHPTESLAVALGVRQAIEVRP